MPAAEVDIDADLVRALLIEQVPALSAAPLRLLANGWDNVLFRLGDEWVVRLPRREVAAALVEHEQHWLPVLAAQLPLPIPTPVHAGHPGHGFPWRWSVVRWFAGGSALEQPPRDLSEAATALGRFVAALHTAAPVDAPRNPVRGVPLRERSSRFDDAIAAVSTAIDTAHARALWSELVDTAPWTGPPVWLHGDLHPGNLVVHDGA